MSKEDFFAGCLIIVIAGICVFFAIFFRLPETGEHRGYVTAIDSDIFCTKVYFKTDLSSSQEDQYRIPKGNSLLEELKSKRDRKENVTISYKKNVIGLCDQDITEIKE